MRDDPHGRKKSIYIGDSIAKVLNAVETDQYNRSGRLNTVCERYLAMVASTMPEFSENEWMAILDANNGVTSDTLTAAHSYANIWDYPHELLSEKWDIDAKDLASRITVMPLPSRLAIAEAIDRYWSGDAWTCSLKSEALDKIGARVTQKRAEKVA